MSYLCKKIERMKRAATLLLLCFLAIRGLCAVKGSTAEPTDSFRLIDKYLKTVEMLAQQRDSLNATSAADLVPNPYYFQVLSTPTLYSGPLRQMMSKADSTSADPQLQRLYSSGKMLATFYTHTPQLVAQTEAEIKEQAAIRGDVNEKLQVADKLSDKVEASLLKPEITDPVEVITRKPNWWKFSGQTQLHFQQNHFTQNWYQGGESNYAGTFSLTLYANYNDQKKIDWKNTFEGQIGFQTTDTDKERSVRVTSNQLRFTTNFGYKAWHNWYYSLQANMKTQAAPNYERNSDKVTSKFLSPLEVEIAPGMKYNIAWGKKKRFTGTFNVGLLALNIFHVNDDDLVKRFGLEEGTNNRLTFGPNVTLDTKWQICKQITWTSRIYYTSNYEYHKIDFTNNFDFIVTKLISAKVFLNPRFDDSNEKYKNFNGRYWMFKEWMSLGLTYNF